MALRVSAWIYLAQQTFSGACMLWAIGLSMGRLRASPWRMGLTALLLAMVTMAAAGLHPLLRLAAMALTALAPLAAWPDAPRRFRPRMAALGCILPLMMTGLMRLLSALPGWLALGAGCALVIILARSDGRAPPLPQIATVEVALGRRSATLSALVDTGNLLRDGLTGLPVIVISRRAAARLICLPPDGTLLPGMRLLPVRTVSGVSVMTILRPDRLRIRVGGAWQAAEALIGLSPGGGEGFQALVPAGLMADAPAPPARAAPDPPSPSSQPFTGG